MKNLKEFITEKKEFIVKVPKNIYTTGTKKCNELIKMINDEFDFKIDKLFVGLTNKNFDYIYWNGDSEGYQEESDAIYSLFPSGSTYYDYIDEAEIYEESENYGVLLRFKTKAKLLARYNSRSQSVTAHVHTSGSTLRLRNSSGVQIGSLANGASSYI